MFTDDGNPSGLEYHNTGSVIPDFILKELMTEQQNPIDLKLLFYLQVNSKKCFPGKHLINT